MWDEGIASAIVVLMSRMTLLSFHSLDQYPLFLRDSHSFCLGSIKKAAETAAFQPLAKFIQKLVKF